MLLSCYRCSRLRLSPRPCSAPHYWCKHNQRYRCLKLPRGQSNVHKKRPNYPDLASHQPRGKHAPMQGYAKLRENGCIPQLCLCRYPNWLCWHKSRNKCLAKPVGRHLCPWVGISQCHPQAIYARYSSPRFVQRSQYYPTRRPQSQRGLNSRRTDRA